MRPRSSYVTSLIGQRALTGLRAQQSAVGVEVVRREGLLRAQLVLPKLILGSEVALCGCFDEPQEAERRGGRAARAYLSIDPTDTVEVHGFFEDVFANPVVYGAVLLPESQEAVKDWNTREGTTQPIHFCSPRDEF